MDKEMIQKFIAEKTLTIADAMTKIDLNSHRVLFVVEKEGALIGCLTDGDIRRWLIKTGDLHASISLAMNQKPIKIMTSEKMQAFDVMNKYSIEAVPVVNVQGRIEDIIFGKDRIVLEKKNKNNELQEVPVVIMAGGKGTRLYPYTKILPKPLIPIGEIPILERIINCFCEYGINQYYMTVNYKKGMIRSYFSELNTSYSIEYVEEEKPLGTAGSIKLIDKEFSCPFFVTNCDILIQADYSDIYGYHIESENAMTIVSALKNVIVPYGVINSKENGVITSIEEKPKLSYFVNTGMYVINPEVINDIPKDSVFHMTDLASALMKSGHKVGMYPISEDSFLDMGEFEEMRRMEAKLNLKSE